MNYDMLLGVAVGMLIVAVAYGFTGKAINGETDERSEWIKVQARATAFSLTGALVLVAWVTDNVLAYIAGAPPRIVSPWSAMYAAMLLIYLGSTLYKKWQFSVWADLDALEQGQVRKKSVALFGGATGLAVSARITLERGQMALGWFLFALMCVEVVAGFYLVIRTTKRRSSH